jgi:hydroxyacylglutathione hydrolase
LENEDTSSSRRSIRKDNFRIEALVVPPLSNNVYILYEDGSDKGTVIDVAQGANALLKRIRELDLTLQLIINTHGHTDHTVEDEILRRATGAKLAIHELDAYRLASEDEASDQLQIVKRPIEPDIQLVEGEKLQIGPGTSLKVFHTPGHTEGSICLYEERLGQLFSGDTLFAGGYGRIDGIGANPEAMITSLRRLMTLPRSTDVYPGHGSFTKLESESWISETIDNKSL